MQRVGANVYVFAGTCFSFLEQHWFLTAAHVVRDVDPEDLGVALFVYQEVKDEEGLPVRSVSIHPSADVALIRLDVELTEEFPIFDPYSGLSPVTDLGDSLRTFGFPEQSTETGVTMVPRMLRGYVQRHFRHQSPAGYQYYALELSHTAPSGMSGSPVSLDGDSSRVVGVLTEDFQSTTVLHSITEIEEDGQRFMDRAHAVVNYGVAADLRPLQEWLRNTMAEVEL